MKNIILSFAAFAIACISVKGQPNVSLVNNMNPLVRNVLAQQYIQSAIANKSTNSGQRLISASLVD